MQFTQKVAAETHPSRVSGTLKKADPAAKMAAPVVCVNNVPPEPVQSIPGTGGSRTNALRKKFSKISLPGKKSRLEKWPQQIDETAHGQWPVSPSTDVFSLYPWTGLRKHTDDLVAKSKVTGSERELLLLSLINDHHNKVLALSACSHLLSQQTLDDILGEFSKHVDTALYLQAFVAASHGNYSAFSREDEAWATTLVGSQGGLLSQTPDANSIHVLFDLVSTKSLPEDTRLRDTARNVINNVLTTVKAALEACENTLDWIRAEPIAAALSNLSRRRDVSAFMLEIVDHRIPDWQHWALWRPSKERHRLWLASSVEWPNPFWTLLSPDFVKDNSIYPTSLERIIAEGKFSSWLEKNHIILGPGLLFDDQPSDMREFVKLLFPVIDLVCKHHGIYATFFRHLLLDNSGLDGYTLALWRAAEAALFVNNAPFLEAVLRAGFGSEHNIRDVFAGLGALNSPGCKELRKYLRPSLWTAVRKAANDIRASFMKLLRSGRDWMPAARSLEFFRAKLAQFPWIDDIKVAGLSMKYAIDPRSLVSLNQLHQSVRSRESDLLDTVVTYIKNYVLGLEPDEYDHNYRLVKVLHGASESAEHCSVALTIGSIVHLPLAQRSRLIYDLKTLPDRKVQKLEPCLVRTDATPATRVCQRIVRLAVQVLRQRPSSNDSWLQLVLYVMKKKHGLDPATAFQRPAFTSCSLKKYRNWLNNLMVIFGTSITGLSDACAWTEKLADHSHALEALRLLQNSTNALHSIFIGSNERYSDMILHMLQSIKDEKDPEKLIMKRHMALAFTLEKANSEAVSQAIVLLSSVSESGFNMCQRLVTISVQQSKEIAKVQLDIWAQTLTTSDRTTHRLLACLAKALQLPSSGKPHVAKTYFSQRVAELMEKAKGLEDLRFRLQQKDRRSVTAIIKRLGIEDNSSVLENELEDLSADLRSHVEAVGDNILELQFPLDHLNDTKCLAMGVQRGESLVVRLCINDEGQRESFCAHVIDPTTDWQSIKHKPLNILTTTNLPNRLLCEGTRDTRLGYFVMRRAFESFKFVRNRPSLTEIYKGFHMAIALSGSDCIVCAKSLNCQMYRAVVCANSNCQQVWLQSSLEVRLADLRLDEGAVELLLAAIYAAASTKSVRGLDLLPNCPPRLNDPSKLLLLLDNIPPVKTLQALSSLAMIKDRYSLRAELLLSWACNSFRGCLAEATGALKIPNMPGVKQFIVADSSPEITAAFSRWDTVQPRQVLFHGTSYDRLYAILNQGLIVLSNSVLQAHGAAAGPGIYLAEQPSMSLGYAGSIGLNSTFANQHAEIVNRTILLGIEYAGNDANRGNGMHVASDSTRCCVRYVFLCPPGFAAPVAHHITPAMLSNFSILKQGARAG